MPLRVSSATSRGSLAVQPTRVRESGPRGSGLGVRRQFGFGSSRTGWSRLSGWSPGQAETWAGGRDCHVSRDSDSRRGDVGLPPAAESILRLWRHSRAAILRARSVVLAVHFARDRGHGRRLALGLARSQGILRLPRSVRGVQKAREGTNLSTELSTPNTGSMTHAIHISNKRYLGRRILGGSAAAIRPGPRPWKPRPPASTYPRSRRPKRT